MQRGRRYLGDTAALFTYIKSFKYTTNPNPFPNGIIEFGLSGNGEPRLSKGELIYIGNTFGILLSF